MARKPGQSIEDAEPPGRRGNSSEREHAFRVLRSEGAVETGGKEKDRVQVEDENP